MQFTIYKLRNRIHGTIIILDIRHFFGGRVAVNFKTSFSDFLTGSIKQLRKEEK